MPALSTVYFDLLLPVFFLTTLLFAVPEVPEDGNASNCACPPLGSTTYTVTNTNDSGAGSLREAITCANTDPNLDDIGFSIAGGGPHIILLQDELPTITDDGITINGGTLGDVELDGSDLTGELNGLVISNADNIEILSLYIHDFPDDGISVEGGNTVGIFNNILSGNGRLTPDGEGLYVFGGTMNLFVLDNLIGTDATGSVAMPNSGDGIDLNDVETFTLFSNVTSGNQTGGIILNNCLDGWVNANFSGLNLGATAEIPNTGGPGIELLNSQVITIDQNYFSANSADGIILNGSSTDLIDIFNNTIGSGTVGTEDFPNDGFGIRTTNGASAILIYQNNIANNLSGGIQVGSTSSEVHITINSIYCNNSIGIDLVGSANNSVQAPTIVTATSSLTAGTSSLSQGDTVQVFYVDQSICAFASTVCQGYDYLGFALVDANGNWSLNDGIFDGEQVTAVGITTDGNSSEFAACVTIPQQCSHPDFDALMALYNSTDGPNWTNNTGWADGAAGFDCDPCSWYGIGCDGNNRVTCIELDGLPDCLENTSSATGNNLVGTIPAAIDGLTELQLLNLSDNELSGSIPSSIANLSNLISLRLGWNNLSGSIPSEIGQMGQLEDLWLWSNNLSGTIPPELSNLSNLNIFELGSNALSGSIPDELSALTGLTIFTVSNNNLSGSIPSWLASFSVLNFLNLHDNNFTGSLPDGIGQLNFLQWYNASGNNLSGCIPVDYQNLCGQATVTLTGNAGLDEQDFTEFCNSSSGVCSACPTSGTTVTVTNTNDSGPGSLREAIGCVNADPVLDNIEFNIPGGGPHVISIFSAELDPITDDGVSIDATTQPGWSLGNVVLEESNPLTGLQIEANDVGIFGLKISEFINGIVVTSSNNVQIGDASRPNCIVSSNNAGIYLAGGNDGVVIQNNYIGVDESGSIGAGNFSGINCQTFSSNSGLLIENNIISANAGDGLSFGSGAGVIRNNLIGTGVNETEELGNGDDGMSIFSAGTLQIEFNTFVNNGNRGIYVNTSTGPYVITQNRFACNVTQAIRSTFGTTDPAVTSATMNSISGTHNNGGLDIEVYATNNSSCPALPCNQGYFYLGTTTTDAGGNWTLNAPFNSSISIGDDVVALAVYTNQTSEFSPCFTVNAGCTSITANVSNSGDECIDQPYTVNVIFTGGTPPYDFTITENGTPFSFTGQPSDFNWDRTQAVAGNYSYEVTAVTDASGCDVFTSFTSLITVFEINGGTLSLPGGGTSVNICTGDGVADPVTTVVAGNSSGGQSLFVAVDNNETILGSGTGNTFDFEGAGAGGYSIYHVTHDGSLGGVEVGNNLFTDLTGCYGISSGVTVNATASGTLSLNGFPSDPSCPGASDGSISINVSGAQGPVTYDWNPDIYDGQEDLFGLSASTYALTVSDDSGCEAFNDFSLLDPSPINLTGCTNTTDASTATTADGSLTVNVSGGNPPYDLSWTGPSPGNLMNQSAGNSTLSNLLPGNYMLTVTDDNNCTVNCNFTIGFVACNLSVSGTTIGPSCFGVVDGAINLTVTGAVGTPVFAWSDGSIGNTEDPSGLAAGFYEVTVTDGAGCTASTFFNLTDPTVLTLSCSESVSASGPANADGEAAITVGGGSPGYELMWSGPSSGSQILAGPATATISNLLPGDYSLTATDVNDCEVICNFAIGTDTGTALSLDCPDDGDGTPNLLTYSTGPFDCNGAFTIPSPIITDGCPPYNTTVEIYDEFDFFLQTVTVGSMGPSLPVGDYYLRYMVVDDCSTELVVDCSFEIVDMIEPSAVCDDDLNVLIGGGDTANGIEGMARVFAADVDEGSSDNCSELRTEVRRNYWFNGSCSNNANQWSDWGPFVDFLCCDIDIEITIELRVWDDANGDGLIGGPGDLSNTCWLVVTPGDNIRPFCYPPIDVTISCTELPPSFPQDLQESYSSDFAETSETMSVIFGNTEGTDNCAVDTIVELTPTINMNSCGWGTITRRFQAWQFEPAGDANGNGAIDIEEVLTSTNTCTQTINILEYHDYTINFPPDLDISCGNPDIPDLDYSENGCDLLAINVSDPVEVGGTGSECYGLDITYSVINWCLFDGDASPVVIPRVTGGDELVDSCEAPAVNAQTTNINTGATTGTITRACAADSTQDPDVGFWQYTQHIRVFGTLDDALVVAPYGGPTPDCPDLLTGQFGTLGSNCEADVTFNFQLADCNNIGAGSGTNLTVVEVSLDTFALDGNGNDEIDLTEFTFDADLSSVLTTNPDGSYTLDFTAPIIPLSADPATRHAVLIRVTDDCGNEEVEMVTFEVIDCIAPSPTCINGLAITLMPQPDGSCAMTIWASDFLAASISDCSEPIQYAIYRAANVEAAGPAFIPNPNDIGLVLDESDDPTTIVYIYAIDAAGNFDYCETFVLVEPHTSCDGNNPLNDDCATATDFGQTLNCDGTIYTNLGATPTDIGFNNTPSCFNDTPPNADVWFTFVVPVDMIDVQITVEGVTNGPNGAAIDQPELALYNGDCGVDGLSELICSSASAGQNSVTLTAEGLTPGVTYYIRINDWGNPGDFSLCIEELTDCIYEDFCINGLAISIMPTAPDTDADGDGDIDCAAMDVWATDFVSVVAPSCLGDVEYALYRTNDPVLLEPDFEPMVGAGTPLTLTCPDAGGEVEVRLYYIAEDGSFGFCETSILVQDATSACPAIPILIDCAELNPATNGQSDGEATVTFSGGAAPYTVSYTGPLSGSQVENATGTTTIPGLAAGDYTIAVTDADGCGEACQVTISAENTTDFTVSFPDVLATPGETICVPVTVSGFVDILSIQYSMHYDPAVLSVSGTQNYGLPGLGANDFGDLGDGDLTVLWINDDLSGETLADDAVLYEVCFDVLDCGTSALSFDDNPTEAEVIVLGNQEIPFNSQSGSLTTPDPPTILSCMENMPASDGVTADGAADVLVAGGTPPYNLSWTGPSSGSQSGTATITNLLPGDYTLTVTDDNGCLDSCMLTISSIQNCALTTTPTTTPALCGTPTGSATVTVGGGSGSYTYNWSTGTTTTDNTLADLSPGSYDVTVVDGGCEEIVPFTVGDQNTPIFNNEMATICEQDTFFIGTMPFTASGSYFGTIPSVNGCDSTVLLSLEVLPIAETFIEGEYCSGDADQVIINGTIYDEAMPSGMEVFPSLAANGCDSVVFVNLTFFAPTVFNDTLIVCPGEDVTINDFILNVDNPFYADTTVAGDANGCDLVRNYTLTFHPAADLLDTLLCAGSSFTIFGTEFSEDNPTAEVSTGLLTVNNCDSTIIVNASFVQSDTLLDLTICVGDTVAIGGDLFYFGNSSGEVILPNAGLLGCDSTIVVQLDFFPEASSTFTETLCENDTLFFNGEQFYLGNASGEIVLDNAAATGCDSTIQVSVDFLPVIPYSETIPLCEGEPFEYEGNTYFAPDIIENTLTSANGCDSVVTLTLEAFPTYEIQLDTTLCADESITIGDDTFSATGSYAIPLTTVERGCDSLIQLNLVVLEVVEAILDTTLCSGEVITINDQLFTEANPTAEQHLVTAAGCDSLLTVTVSFTPLIESQLDTILCAGESIQIGGQVYDSALEDEMILLPGAASSGCDSAVLANVSFYPLDESTVDVTICENESYLFFGEELTAAGQYIDAVTNSLGCDSTVTLNLSVIQVDTTFLNELICPGDGFEFCGEVYFEESTLSCTYSTLTCDSVVILNLMFDTPDALFAEDDAYEFFRSDGTLDFEVLENDLTDESFQIEILNAPQYGTLELLDDRFRFTPDEQFFGLDSFQYALCPLTCPEVCDTATVYLNIEVDCLAEIIVNAPTAFSPGNGDGVNDIFSPVGFAGEGCDINLDDISLIVINVNGEIVFQAQPYQPWDGRSVNGAFVPEATYFYILEYEDQVIKRPIVVVR